MSGEITSPGVQLIQKQVRKVDYETQFNSGNESVLNRRLALGSVLAVGGATLAVVGYKAMDSMHPSFAEGSPTPTPLYSGDCPSPYAGRTSYSNPADSAERPFVSGQADLGVYPSVMYPLVRKGREVNGAYINRDYACVGEETYIHIGIPNSGAETVPNAELDVSGITPGAGIVIDSVTTEDNRISTPVRLNSSTASSAKYELGPIAWGSVPYYDVRFHTTKPASNQQIGIRVSNGNSAITNPDGSTSPLVDPDLANNDAVYSFNSQMYQPKTEPKVWYRPDVRSLKPNHLKGKHAMLPIKISGTSAAHALFNGVVAVYPLNLRSYPHSKKITKKFNVLDNKHSISVPLSVYSTDKRGMVEVSVYPENSKPTDELFKFVVPRKGGLRAARLQLVRISH